MATKLAPVVESLEAIPEAQREFYEESEGKFVLSTDIEAHPGVAGLKSAHSKEKQARKASSEKVTALETQIAELQAQKDELENKGKGTSDIDKVIAKRKAELEAEYAPLKTRNAELESKLNARDRSEAIRKASSGAGIMDDRREDALNAADRWLDFKDGKLIVLDDDGDPSGMSPEKFFAEKFKEKKPFYYEGTGSSGSGTPPGGKPPAQGTIKLTREQAGDAAQYNEALTKVGGDHSKIRVE